ncbi:MAG: protein phosphatase 2C domain-containing protein [Myxococcales bacterium]
MSSPKPGVQRVVWKYRDDDLVRKAYERASGRAPVKPPVKPTGGAAPASLRGPGTKTQPLLAPRRVAPTVIDPPSTPLEDIAAPPGYELVGSVEDRWCMEPTTKAWSLGCFSHLGPADVDKTNEDFAFAIEHEVSSKAIWLLAGVADGVGNSTWSKRGAKHASAAFIESVAKSLESVKGVAFDDTIWNRLRTEVASAFHRNLRRRLEQDEERIVRERHVDPAWGEKAYVDRFFLDPDAEKHRRVWFQSTLLATALGPWGGFALLLGDGLVRTDRCRKTGWDAPTLPKLSEGEGSPAVVASFHLTQGQVQSALVPIRAKDADRIAVLMATDGVEKSPRHELDGQDWSQLGITSSLDCEKYLRKLAGRPKGQVEWDNMSLAFVERGVK